MGETRRAGRRPNKIVTERTRGLIIDSGRKEFLNVGYQKASLRAIARNAGQTTGAIYAHFRDKRDLFDAIVRPATEGLEAMFLEAQDEHFDLVRTGEAHRSLELSTEKLRFFMGYIYDNFDSFRLLLSGAEGASSADFIRRLVDLNTEGTVEYLRAIRDAGGEPGMPDPEILRILTTCYYTAAFEPVVRGMTREEAVGYIETIAAFFNAGWETLLDFGDPPPNPAGTGPAGGDSSSPAGLSGAGQHAPSGNGTSSRKASDDLETCEASSSREKPVSKPSGEGCHSRTASGDSETCEASSSREKPVSKPSGGGCPSRKASCDSGTGRESSGKEKPSRKASGDSGPGVASFGKGKPVRKGSGGSGPGGAPGRGGRGGPK
ncbi:MAG: TetR/AcrR family transcriptional regulator [Deltaproteobacteria bacterium]|nr:TetR/AcrR family transcriptional regulator [Deltaproteobacteria bacterium]